MRLEISGCNLKNPVWGEIFAETGAFPDLPEG
jgi:hypothetical protein